MNKQDTNQYTPYLEGSIDHSLREELAKPPQQQLNISDMWVNEPPAWTAAPFGGFRMESGSLDPNFGVSKPSTEPDIPMVFPEQSWTPEDEEKSDEPVETPVRKRSVALNINYSVEAPDFTKQEALEHLYKAITLLEMTESETIDFSLAVETR